MALTEHLHPNRKDGADDFSTYTFFSALMELKDVLELNENEGTIYPNIWDSMNIVLRARFIALCAYIKTLNSYHASSLTSHPKL